MRVIRLANSIKCGSREDYLFNEQQAKIELFALKLPVLNGAPGEVAYQPVVKLTCKRSGKSTFTSLMNAIYWELAECPAVETSASSRLEETKEQLRKLKDK